MQALEKGMVISMKKKLTGKQIKFIINIVSLAIFAFSYLYIYTNLVKDTEDSYKKIKSAEQYHITLENKVKKKDEVQQKTEELNGQIQVILDSYPVDIKTVDNLLFVSQMEKELGMTFNSVYASDSSYFCDTTLPMRNADGTEVSKTADITSKEESTIVTITVAPESKSDNIGSKDQSDALNDIEAEVADDKADKTSDKDKTVGPPTMTGLEATITMSFQTTVEGFTSLVDYINNYPSKTAIDSVSITVDNTTGMLNGSLVIKRFALAGTGKVYEEPKIDDISIGTEDIFGIGSGAAEEPAPATEPEETQQDTP